MDNNRVHRHGMARGDDRGSSPSDDDHSSRRINRGDDRKSSPSHDHHSSRRHGRRAWSDDHAFSSSSDHRSSPRIARGYDRRSSPSHYYHSSRRHGIAPGNDRETSPSHDQHTSRRHGKMASSDDYGSSLSPDRHRSLRIARGYDRRSSPSHYYHSSRRFNSLHHPMLRHSTEDFDYTLQEWFQILRTRPSLSPFRSYTGETHNFVDNEVQKQIRSLVMFLFYLKDKGYCLDKDAFRSVVIRQETLKFPESSLVTYDELLSIENFNQLGDFIRMTFFERVNFSDLPYDMRSFLTLLENPNPKSEGLLKNHIALMSATHVGNLINVIHNIQPQLTKLQRQDYLGALGYSNDVNTWKNSVPKDGIFRSCLEFREYSGRMDDRTRFFRNCMEHLIDYARKEDWRHGVWTSLEPFFTIDEVPKMIIALFGDMITTVFESLHAWGVLSLLKLERFF